MKADNFIIFGNYVVFFVIFIFDLHEKWTILSFLLDNMVKIHKYVHVCISKLSRYYYIFMIFFSVLRKIPVDYMQNKTGDILIYISPVHLCC